MDRRGLNTALGLPVLSSRDSSDTVLSQYLSILSVSIDRGMAAEAGDQPLGLAASQAESSQIFRCHLLPVQPCSEWKVGTSGQQDITSSCLTALSKDRLSEAHIVTIKQESSGSLFIPNP